MESEVGNGKWELKIEKWETKMQTKSQGQMRKEIWIKIRIVNANRKKNEWKCDLNKKWKFKWKCQWKCEKKWRGDVKEIRTDWNGIEIELSRNRKGIERDI